MNRFDPAHQTNNAFDEKLAAALHEVDVPADLKARLLDSVADPRPNKVTKKSAVPAHESGRLSRRRWLASGVAATVSGLGLWGSYHWAARSLSEEDVWAEVSKSLLSSDWKAFNPRGVAPPYPFSRSLMTHSGWQARPTGIDAGTVAFNLSREGVPAVLFVMRSGHAAKFPPLQQAKPTVLTGAAARDWNHIAIWRDKSATYLYVLAYDGRREDFDRFFGGRTIPFA